MWFTPKWWQTLPEYLPLTILSVGSGSWGTGEPHNLNSDKQKSTDGWMEIFKSQLSFHFKWLTGDTLAQPVWFSYLMQHSTQEHNALINPHALTIRHSMAGDHGDSSRPLWRHIHLSLTGNHCITLRHMTHRQHVTGWSKEKETSPAACCLQQTLSSCEYSQKSFMRCRFVLIFICLRWNIQETHRCSICTHINMFKGNNTKQVFPVKELITDYFKSRTRASEKSSDVTTVTSAGQTPEPQHCWVMTIIIYSH